MPNNNDNDDAVTNYDEWTNNKSNKNETSLEGRFVTEQPRNAPRSAAAAAGYRRSGSGDTLGSSSSGKGVRPSSTVYANSYPR